MSGQPPSSPAQAGATRAPTPVESKFLAAILKNSDGVTNVSFISYSHPLCFDFTVTPGDASACPQIIGIVINPLTATYPKHWLH